MKEGDRECFRRFFSYGEDDGNRLKKQSNVCYKQSDPHDQYQFTSIGMNILIYRIDFLCILLP